MFCGSALAYIGVQRLLDGVVDYLPSPLDMPADDRATCPSLPGQARKARQESPCPHCDPTAPLVAYVFKIVADKPMDLYFVRVYSGTLKTGSRVLNPARDKKENISRMFRMFAKRREQIDAAEAGDIVAVLGLKESLTGDTLCDAEAPGAAGEDRVPRDGDQHVHRAAVVGRPRQADRSADDAGPREPDVRVLGPTRRPGQTLISGMGELHLEVLVNRLRRDMNVDVRVGKPRVSYRETVIGRGRARGGVQAADRRQGALRQGQAAGRAVHAAAGRGARRLREPCCRSRSSGRSS